MNTEQTPKDRILQWAAKHGVTMAAEFVPFSQSRNKGEKSPSLNWRVTIQRNGRAVLTTDYSAGCGHCDAYKASVVELGGQNCIMRDEVIRRECETGKSYKGLKKYNLDLDSVLWSLSMDYGVINYATYEDWAVEYGYDPDSRKGEAIYRACLEIALKLRAALGDDAMAELAEAGQDY